MDFCGNIHIWVYRIASSGSLSRGAIGDGRWLTIIRNEYRHLKMFLNQKMSISESVCQSMHTGFEKGEFLVKNRK